MTVDRSCIEKGPKLHCGVRNIMENNCRLVSGLKVTWRRTIEKECRLLGEPLSELKHIAETHYTPYDSSWEPHKLLLLFGFPSPHGSHYLRYSFVARHSGYSIQHKIGVDYVTSDYANFWVRGFAMFLSLLDTNLKLTAIGHIPGTLHTSYNRKNSQGC